MLRIFGHFEPVPALFVGLCEILLLVLAIYLATKPTEAAALTRFSLISSSAQFSVVFAGLCIGAMGVVGLYNLIIASEGVAASAT
jgi:hypothetical protein